jgi:hypothetical protein
MKHKVRYAGLLSIFAFAHGANATGVNKWPFSQQVNDSDLVVFAKMDDTNRNPIRRIDRAGQELTRMKVLSVLKGREAVQEIDFVTKGAISELNPACCVRGKIYLLLLRRGRGSVFEATNGRYSAIAVP